MPLAKWASPAPPLLCWRYAAPDRLYGVGSNYQFQRLKLSKQFTTNEIDDDLGSIDGHPSLDL